MPIKSTIASSTTEPLWARNKSDLDLRKVCKMFRVPGNHDEWDRKQLIKSCDYLVVYPSLKGDMDVLRQKCSKSAMPPEEIQKMSEEELVNCITNNRIDMFQISMGIQTKDELEETLDVIGGGGDLTPEARRELIRQNEAGKESLKQFIKNEAMDDKTFEFVTTISQEIQKTFARDLQEVLRLMESVKSGVDTIQSQKIMSEHKSWWNSIGRFFKGALKRAGSITLGILKFIVTNPYVARMMGLIALRIKRSLCRDLSIKLNYIRYLKERSVTDKVVGVAKDASNTMQDLIPNIAHSFFSGEGFTNMMGLVQNLTVDSLSSTLSMLPVIGDSAAKTVDLVGNVVFKVATDAAREAAELALYSKAVSDSTRSLLDLIDLRGCIAEQEVEDNARAPVEGSYEQSKQKRTQKSKSKSKRRR